MMQEEEQQPQQQEQQLPKKRGRKPKNQSTEKSTEEAKTPKKRGRKPKNQNAEKELLFNIERTEENTQNGPQWRDAPEPSQEPVQEADDVEEITFDAPTSDDFAYATSSSDDKAGNNDEEDDDIPTSYSTTDEDLIQDNYQNSWVDDEEEKDDAQSLEQVDSEAEVAQVAEAEQAHNQQKHNDNRQNRQNNKWRKDNNRFNKNQNQGQNQNNNRFNNKNQNRQNNNRQNQQNGQNKNRQQNQKQNNNQQNKQQKQNKPRWLQQNTESDFINPSELFDWEALQSQETIEKYLAKIYFGKDEQQPELSLDETVSAEQIVAPESAVEVLDVAQEEAEKLNEPDTSVSEQAVEEENPAEKPQPSYWEMLEQSNKDLYAKSEDIPASLPEAETSPKEVVEENPTVDEVDFVEDATFAIADCGTIESFDNFNEIYAKPLREIQQTFDNLAIPHRQGLNKNALLEDYFKFALEQKKLVKISGIIDVFENGYGGAIVFESDNYRLRKFSVYIPKLFIEKYSLARGHNVTALVAPPKSANSCPFVVKICSVMGANPEKIKDVVAFNDLTPYYPTERIIMESDIHNAWNNVSMRAVDLLSPIGLGQRALIVAPPRTGKTVLMQTMAKSIRANKPNAHLMILLVDERPEEVTDFKRSVDAEVISSTFDEESTNHIHAAEMVISKARRMVEFGKDVIILLDSITRLARAYNASMPNGGRTMSGGVEANALQKPKKFFGSARNIEDGGSLTIIATALVETGSKMDEVIFEEFKGTGNLELHLDRALSDKRIFPAINMEKTGTRKEELLYHPAELEKVYTLRRAMNGVPITESMEMLVQRLKKTKTNVEFLLGLNR